MGSGEFSKNKAIPLLLLFLIVLIGIFIFKTYYIVARDYMNLGSRTDVVTEISLDEYQTAMFEDISRARYMNTETKNMDTEKVIKLEDIQQLLADPQYCAVQLYKTSESNSTRLIYHAAAIAKKHHGNYSVLDSTVINQSFETTDGTIFEPNAIHCQLADDGHLKVSSQGRLIMDKELYKSLKPHQSNYTYRESSDDYCCPVSLELSI